MELLPSLARGSSIRNQKNIFVSPYYVTSIVFNFVQVKDKLVEIVSVWSESTQLPSEPINVMILSELCAIPPCSTTTYWHNYNITLQKVDGYFNKN